ncbi:MAG: hypothetical protein PHE83_14945 [Opitutaceae bacterium]|nr:hypothetical protein [Opitutaceae bacterium]
MKLVQKHGKRCMEMTLEEALALVKQAWQEHPDLPLSEVYLKASARIFAHAPSVTVPRRPDDFVEPEPSGKLL